MNDLAPLSAVWLQGDFTHADFAELCRLVGDPDPNISPEIIAFCQSRPGQLAQSAIEQFYAAMPLAHLMLILGSWCEGEQRSGYPIHGVERVYWYDAAPRLRQLRHTIRSPRTATAAERIELHCQQLSRTTDHIIVIARSRLERLGLADACTALGLSSTSVDWNLAISEKQNTDVDHFLLAADDLSAPELTSGLDQLRAAWPHANVIAVLNFPRRDEIDQLRALGCHQVLGKPFHLSDLAATLHVNHSDA